MTVNHVLPFTVYISRPDSGEEIGPGFNSGGVAVPLWEILRSSQFFPNYQPMFDQVRFDKCRVKVTGSAADTGLTGFSSPTVCMAFDRNGLNATQVNSAVPNSQHCNVLLNSSLVSTYSSSQIKQWSAGNSFVMYQTIMPSTILEKGQYIPTGSLVRVTEQNLLSTSNPCNILTDPTVPFKPVVLIAVTSPFVNVNDNMSFSFTVEFEFVVTFRGMRKPSLGSELTVGSPDNLIPLVENITENGSYQFEPDLESVDGYKSVSIDVNVPVPDIQGVKHVDVVQNGSVTVSPDDGFDAVEEVVFDVNVRPHVDLVPLSINISSLEPMTFNPSNQGHDGYSSVNVSFSPSIYSLPLTLYGVSFLSGTVRISSFVKNSSQFITLAPNNTAIICYLFKYGELVYSRWSSYKNTNQSSVQLALTNSSYVIPVECLVYNSTDSISNIAILAGDSVSHDVVFFISVINISGNSTVVESNYDTIISSKILSVPSNISVPTPGGGGDHSGGGANP